MEIKIGVTHAPRELTIETSQSADEISKLLADALGTEGGILELHDDRGRSIHVPAEKLAYVEISGGGSRRVGFGARSV